MATNNNSADKITNLLKYVDVMKNRLTNIPERHKNNTAYSAWVNREIKMTQLKIDSLKK